ncbi:hypothetical protein [Rufibacter latericius]|uniref:Lipoprotein n=1 Tax=Rufibacter latericius TaxID=2487040 RepID=A0A3M9MU59_9BACT|nr:hypothetical protein [Rufibacter latericius]RNI28717.1 hypothetical protein EFB08_08775 [Rufibacter latericius]
MKASLYILLFFLVLSCKDGKQNLKEAQNVPSESKSFDYSLVGKETLRLAEKIAKVNEVMSSAVYEAGVKPEQYKTFEALTAKASTPELKALLGYPNNAVKCYSFWALTLRRDKDCFDILKEYLQDTSRVDTQFGCIGSSTTIGDFYLDLLTPNYVGLDSYKLDKAQQKQIDSLLIFDKTIQLSAKTSLLNKIKPNEHYYSRVKQILQEEGNEAALIALAKYRKPEDKTFILSFLNDPEKEYYGIKAVKFFPAPEFLEPLAQIQAREIMKDTGFDYSLYREMYQAMVQFKNKESAELLEKPFTKATQDARPYHLEYIWLAIEKYPNTLYSRIQSKIQLTEYEKEDLNYWLKEVE